MANLLSDAIHGLAARYADWRSRQRAYAELSALDDRDLADIGISRSEIPYLLARGEAEAQAPATAAKHGHDILHAA
jgi:uncharacterized protein YjiS (DUF1127 family)